MFISFYIDELHVITGYYYHIGIYNGEEVNFTLYKCSMKNGGYRWFLSITPFGKEPGTADDTDFYFAYSQGFEILPPNDWKRLESDYVSDPAPNVTCDGPVNESDTENDNVSNDGFDSDQMASTPQATHRNGQMVDSDSDVERIYGDPLDDSFTSAYSEN